MLRTMIVGYDKKGHKSVIQYFLQTVTISHSPKEVRKEFGIPNKGQDLATTPSKMTTEENKKMARADL